MHYFSAFLNHRFGISVGAQRGTGEALVFSLLCLLSFFSRHRVSFRVTLSCHTLYAPPHFAVLVRFNPISCTSMALTSLIEPTTHLSFLTRRLQDYPFPLSPSARRHDHVALYRVFRPIKPRSFMDLTDVRVLQLFLFPWPFFVPLPQLILGSSTS